MKKALKITFIVLLLLLIKFVITTVINEIVIYNYNNKIYNNNLIKTLYIFNITERYIPYYNDGNLYYMNNNYKEAENKYTTALKKHPPKKRLCDIKVNLSLSKIKQINPNENKNDIINKLEEIKQILLEDNCASLSGTTGESNDAEELKQEIEKLENEIKNGNGDNNNNNNNNNNNSNENKNQYGNIEQKIKEKEKQSNSSRQSNMSKYENLNNYEYYKGKKW